MGRIIVAMSGGVDSSVAAALAVREGHEVVGITLRLLPRMNSSFGCCGSPKDIGDAKAVCDALGVPHYVLSPTDLFEDKVIAPFVEAYREARTPSPCSECNRGVKFPYLLAMADAWSADAVATGHYARIAPPEAAGRPYRLLKASDHGQDQSYFLHTLTQDRLRRAYFPVGGKTKAEVRALARELGLETADKPDSQDLCFVPQGDYRAFLKERIEDGSAGAQPGTIKDGEGRTLGTHKGLAQYTIGQRKGLGLSGGSVLYVTALDAETNTVVVGKEADLAKSVCRVTGLSWTAEPPGETFTASVRVRHRHTEAPADVVLKDGAAHVTFREPQRALTPGQSAVFYREDEVLGGGMIEVVE